MALFFESLLVLVLQRSRESVTSRSSSASSAFSSYEQGARGDEGVD